MRRAVLLLLATIVAICLPAAASAAVPTDPRISAAAAAWATRPLYVDPDFAVLVDEGPLLQKIETARLPVYVAVVPTGEWFQEKGDTALLAGWLAAANKKPGLYVVMDGDLTYGVPHEIHTSAPTSTYAEAKQPMSAQLSAFLDEVRINDRYDAEPARTEPLAPEPERTYPEDRFTVGKAIGNGLGGGALGLLGGAMLAGLVLGVAALVAGRRGGQQ